MQRKWIEGLGECGEQRGGKKHIQFLPSPSCEQLMKQPGIFRGEYELGVSTGSVPALFFFFWTDEWTMVIGWLFDVRFCSLHHLTLKCAKFRCTACGHMHRRAMKWWRWGGAKCQLSSKDVWATKGPARVCVPVQSAYLQGLIIYTRK